MILSSAPKRKPDGRYKYQKLNHKFGRSLKKVKFQIFVAFKTIFVSYLNSFSYFAIIIIVRVNTAMICAKGFFRGLFILDCLEQLQIEQNPMASALELDKKSFYGHNVLYKLYFTHYLQTN